VDLLSRCSAESIYPRSSEIISNGFGFIQLEGSDSERFFTTEHRPQRIFSSHAAMKSKVDALLNQPEADYVFSGIDFRCTTQHRVNQHNEMILRAMESGTFGRPLAAPAR
jgi:hypothetical protein